MKPAHRVAARRRLGAALAGFTLVAACGGPGVSREIARSATCPWDQLPRHPSKPVEITVWQNYSSASKRTFDKLVEQYNASQSRVHVNSEIQGVAFEETLRKYKLAAEDGHDMPNLVLLEDTTTQVMADSGTIIPAQACVDVDPAGRAIAAGMLPLGRVSYSIGGRLQPVGFDVYTALAYINRSDFKKAGLDPDKPPGTLDEIRAAAVRLKAVGAAHGSPPVVISLPAWQTEWLLTGAGQTIVDHDNGRNGLATTSTFGSATERKVLTTLKQMQDDGLLRAVEGKEGQTDHLFAMALGNASMTVESSAGIPTIAGLLEGSIDPEQLKADLGVALPPGFKLDIDLGVGPWPGIDKAGQGQIGGGAWYLTNTGSEQTQAAAWDFAKWLNGTPQQVAWALEGTGLPSQTSAAEDPVLQQKWTSTLSGRWSTVAWGVLQNVRQDFPGPLIGPYKESREAIRAAVERVMLGDGNISAAVHDADVTITSKLREYRTSIDG